MSDFMRKMGKRMVRETINQEVEYRAVRPIANKISGCATVFFIILFVGLGIAFAIFVARLGGNPDKIGPIAIGIGLFGGIIIGALAGNWVGRVLRRLLMR